MLRFRAQPSGASGAKLVRETYFEPVTDLPISAVCAAANHARARLSNLLARELTLDVFAPVLVKDGTQRVLFERGSLYRARGSICDLYVVFRRRDARRIAQGVFGEECGGENVPLSALEERALERIAAEVAALCAPFCGDANGLARIEPEREDARCVTYFELRIGLPFDAVIGIGLSQDPGPRFGGKLERSMLSGIALDVRAQFAEAVVNAREIAAWRVGQTVRLDTKIGAPTMVKIGDCVVASGDCGIRAQSNAVVIAAAGRREATT
ncbi:MAG: FliM/FliN family flagellar motor C-terminal domain-containing protein [Candidatus Velthaea sp.]